MIGTTTYKIADVVWQIECESKTVLKLFDGFESDMKADIKLTVETADIEKLLRAMNTVLVKDYDGLMLHSAAIIYNKKAYLFVAPSGTGKTTHILLWKKVFGDKVQILNGDKPFIRCKDDSVFVYSSPFKGKEGLGINDKCVLGGIYILKRATQNRVESCPDTELIGSLFNATFDFNDGFLKFKKLEILKKIIKKAPVFIAYCNMQNKAAEVVRAHIEEKGYED